MLLTACKEASGGASQKSKQTNKTKPSRQTNKKTKQMTFTCEAGYFICWELHASDFLLVLQPWNLYCVSPGTHLLSRLLFLGCLQLTSAKDNAPRMCLTFRGWDALLSAVVAHSCGDLTQQQRRQEHLLAFWSRKHFIHSPRKTGLQAVSLLKYVFFSVKNK